jgi:triacylglycerol lipase
MRRLLLALPLAIACAAPPDHASKCEKVSQELSDCAGAERLDCNMLTDADLDRIDALASGFSCKALSEALPLDGDPNAAMCRALGVGCVESVGPKAAYAPTRYPIVLVNGIDTSPLFRWSERIVTTMRDVGGSAVYRATLTPYEPPRVRAPELRARIDEILAETHAEKVNLVCHSLGGLDCRYVASPGGLGYASAIASITTVGTAHHGTRVADVLLGIIPDAQQDDRLDALATLLGDAFSPNEIKEDTRVRDALRSLSLADAPAFEAEIVDADGVVYQSWAGVSRPMGSTDAESDDAMIAACGKPSAFPAADRLALPLLPFADAVGGPNDGFVSVESAKHGEFMGCIPADHMEQLGQKNLPDANVRTGLDIAAFYTQLAADLAAKGL